jgi:hypothetical protein
LENILSSADEPAWTIRGQVKQHTDLRHVSAATDDASIAADANPREYANQLQQSYRVVEGGDAANEKTGSTPRDRGVKRKYPAGVQQALQPKLPRIMKGPLQEDSKSSSNYQVEHVYSYNCFTGVNQITSHLLTSKSNYQHIIEGNHFDLGLSYSEKLPEELKAKRDSRTVAERGRRARMKKALQVLDKLLPRDGVVRDHGHSVDHAGTSTQCSDKIAIVERAVEYIKSLQREVEDMKSTK